MKMKLKRFLSGVMAVATLASVIVQPVAVSASELETEEIPFEQQYPELKDVQDSLDADEIVTANDIELSYGAEFEVEVDLSGIEGVDESKMKILFHEAKNEDGADFDTHASDTYKAVYAVEPVSGHPSYRISRNITVKEPETEQQSESSSEIVVDDNGDTGDTELSEDDSDSHRETENEIASETGLTVSEALEQAESNGIDLYAMDAGETITFMASAGNARSSQQVSVTRGTMYRYADYGYGSYLTYQYNQTSSYELQKNHYEDMIKEHAGWNLVGIYADEGISGTSLLHRDEFNRMITDCQAGKIDLIVTKSVSRFARNIVDCIAKVRELANMKPQVGVFFETEHIYTLDNTSEMMLAVLSAAAQEESHTKSEIMNISIEQRFSRGIFLTPKLLGYDKDEDGNLVINETEADTVRLCYYLFLSGFPTSEIAEILMDLGRKTKLGNTKWTGSAVVNILRNERHCGDVLSRKTFTPNYLDHKSKKNNHDRNQYRQADHHEAIVSREIYNAAQKLLEAGKYSRKGYPLPTLQVVDQGALKGFVPVNRAWNGFSTDDYKKASLSAYDEDTNEIHAEQTNKSAFDLSGYEIVRAQFFSTRFDPAVTISSGKITFNTACMKKFENIEYVELLFNSVEKCIAVRPCEKSNVNAIKWGTIRNGRWAVLPKSCKGFSEPLFELMNWDSDCKYKLRGQFCGNSDEQLLIFELEEPEVFVQEYVEEQHIDSSVEAPSENMKTVKKVLYPKAWIHNFGETTNRTVFLQRIAYKGNWEILRPAKTVEGMEIITREILDDLIDEAEKLIDRMRCATYE